MKEIIAIIAIELVSNTKETILKKYNYNNYISN